MEKWDGKPLKGQEMRLRGQLAYKGFKSAGYNQQLVLSSFSRYNKLNFVRAPKTWARITERAATKNLLNSRWATSRATSAISWWYYP